MTAPEVTPEMVEAFQAAWHKADAEGRTGERVASGLMAALAVAPAPETRVEWGVRQANGRVLTIGAEDTARKWVSKDPNDRRPVRRAVSDWVEVADDDGL